MGPSDTAEIDLYGNRPSDYRMGSSQTIVLHASDSESEPENAAEGSGSGSGDGKEPKGFVSPPASQRKRPLQTNTCKVCQRYWRNEDERLPGQLATKHVASCKIHGNKRRPPNTPENFWKQAQLTPPKNPVKPPVYEYEKRQYRKRNS
ncbi:DNA endonuclease RBBP8-like [Paramacrobiotus metropolitanus]|uniref:DNA endonuclease RBBP8-like n=1 Tax=Paramacrobiotus metropolitanus TaxID=2943436 RepID=UPI002445DAC7|nr:DNA endonuclease RBBP8-like [Paramacrobiotus metropolitanus]